MFLITFFDTFLVSFLQVQDRPKVFYHENHKMFRYIHGQDIVLGITSLDCRGDFRRYHPTVSITLIHWSYAEGTLKGWNLDSILGLLISHRQSVILHLITGARLRFDASRLLRCS